MGCKVTHICMVSPTAGEVFYLYCLLLRQPTRSFNQVRTVDGIMFDTFHEAAIQLGLFINQNKGQYMLADAVICLSVHLLKSNSYSPISVYKEKPANTSPLVSLMQDFTMQTHSEERGVDLCLLSLASSFQEGGRTLSHFSLP